MVIVYKIRELIGLIDRHVQAQLNVIIHHSDIQQLEASWRGLVMLTQTVNKKQRVKVRFLDCALKALSNELRNINDVEQSTLFDKIYTQEFDQPGGTPYGLLVGDYAISHHINHKIDGLWVLEQMMKIAATAFVPFVTSADASLLGLDSYAEYSPVQGMAQRFSAPEYHRWHRLRKLREANFVALTMPRILMRIPYNSDGIRLRQRCFIERTSHHNDYLWGNACYAYASVVIESFENSGWFAEIRTAHLGKHTQQLLGAMRPNLAAKGLTHQAKIITEYAISDDMEQQMGDAGFIALRDHHLAQKSFFYGCQSIKYSKHTMNSEQASEKINTMLDKLFCVSRFAHYVKVIMRDKIGSFTNVTDCERFLSQWLNQYCSSVRGQSLQAILRRPLANAKVTVQASQHQPGKYYCTIDINPHYYFDEMEASLQLITQLRL